jgi:hypothetical protein
MAIRIDTTRNNLADKYTGQGTFFGLATADPGDSATPDPAATYTARVATTWSAAVGGVANGSACIISADADTYTYAILCSAASEGEANMIDNCAITSAQLGGPGPIVLTPTYTQT